MRNKWSFVVGEQIDASKSRGLSIGSSEIASVLGVSPYRSPFQLWDEKTNGSTFTGNKYTKAGTFLEPAVVRFFEDATGADIVPGFVDDIRFTHPRVKIATATPDRLYTRLREGRLIRGIVECKTTQINITDENEVPPSWFCQAQYQAEIFNAYQTAHGGEMCEEITIAWLVRGLEFRYAHFEVDMEFGRHLIERAAEFWENFVETGKAPDYETAEDVLTAYPKHTDGATVEATDETVQAYEQLVGIEAQIKALEEEADIIKDNFKKIMKDAEAVTYFGSVLATWKATKPTRRLDTKRLKAEAPQVYEQFLGEPKSSRRFLIKT
jgi:putative phage-type endonuclease